jgi:2-polyprenyl-3-methyl-5-hydroxy-6-metoxy-1,4-benzoquinol methylase
MSMFDAAYEGVPPWDIGKPQDAVVELERAGRIGATVLDLGCGTGENALFLASKGRVVTGIDDSPRAIGKAREKAAARTLEVTFRVQDALALEGVHERFESVLDSGLFHVFSDRDRARYVAGLSCIVRPGGNLHVLCFSEEERSQGGPRHVTQNELREAFGRTFGVESIKAARFATLVHPTGAKAWLATFHRRDSLRPLN